MITRAMIRFMFLIAKMSKKASAIYISVVSFGFLCALATLLTGMIFLTPNQPASLLSITLIIIGGIALFISTAAVALTAISSNYVRKNPHKDPKKEEPKQP